MLSYQKGIQQTSCFVIQLSTFPGNEVSILLLILPTYLSNKCLWSLSPQEAMMKSEGHADSTCPSLASRKLALPLGEYWCKRAGMDSHETGTPYTLERWTHPYQRWRRTAPWHGHREAGSVFSLEVDSPSGSDQWPAQRPPMSLCWFTLTSYTSRIYWSLWRAWSCGTVHAGSP